MYKELFIQAMKSVLQGTDYVQDDCFFYYYRRSIQVVMKIGFEVIWGGADFRLWGGATSFCEGIEEFPDNWISIQCYEVNYYSCKQGGPSYSNICESENGAIKRYGKKQFIEQLDKNIELFRNRQLPDLLSIDSLDSYYNFKVKADAYGHIAKIPFPGLHSFYLCIQLGKIYEASIIVFQMMAKHDRNIHEIDKILSVRIIEATKDMEYVEDICEYILQLLNANIEKLRIEVERRVDESRRICDQFFARFQSH